MKDKLMQINSKECEHGAVLVEFAILIPFLLLLLVGLAEIGYLYFHLNILNKSVQDAALYFSDPSRARNGDIDNSIDLNDSNSDNIKATENLVIYGNTGGTGSSILPNTASNYHTPAITSPAANHIQVTVTYDHNYMLGDLLRNFCGKCMPATSYQLTASSVFRVEGGS